MSEPWLERRGGHLKPILEGWSHDPSPITAVLGSRVTQENTHFGLPQACALGSPVLVSAV